MKVPAPFLRLFSEAPSPPPAAGTAGHRAHGAHLVTFDRLWVEFLFTNLDGVKLWKLLWPLFSPQGGLLT